MLLAARRQDAARADTSNRCVAVDFVAATIVARWREAGYTTAILVNGLPYPERPHAARWDTGARVPRCVCCGSAGATLGPLPALCDGPDPEDLVAQAVWDGVPFGLRDGIPTAEVALEPSDVVAKIARATCQPVST